MNLRRGLVGALAVLAALGLALYLVAGFQFRSQPFLGVLLTRTLTVNAGVSTSGIEWPGAAAQLQGGDQVVAIQGERLPEGNFAAAREQVNRVLAELPREDGQYAPLELTIQRAAGESVPDGCERLAPGGMECTVTLTPIPFPDIDFLSYFLLPLGTGVLLLLLGLVLLRYRSHSVEGQLAAATAFFSVIFTAGIFDAGTSATYGALWALSACMVGGLFTTLGLIFPKRLKVVRSFPPLPYIPVVLAALVGLLFAVWMQFPPQVSTPRTIVAASILTMALGIVAFTVLMMAQRERATSPLTRDQSNTMFLGGGMLLATGIFWLLTRLLSDIADASLLFNLEAMLIMMLVPNAAVAYAVFQVRVMDTDRGITYGITYGIMGLALVFSTFLLTLGGSLIALDVLNASNALTISGILFVMVLLFTRVQNQLRERIDRVYLRRRHDLQSQVEQFARTMTTLNNYDEIVTEFYRTLRENVAPSKMFLFLQERGGDDYVAHPVNGSRESATDVRFAGSSPLLALLQQTPTCISLQPGEPWPDQLWVDRARLKLLQSYVIVGLQGSEALNGFLILGPPQVKDMYDHDEVRFVDNMSSQLAVATQRSRVIESLEHRVEELSVLRQVGEAVNFTIEFDDLLELIYTQTVRLVDAPNFYIALYEENVKQLYFAFFLEHDERYNDKENDRWDLGSDLFSEVIRTKQAMRVQDFGQEMRSRGALLSIVSSEMRAWMGVPLVAGRNTLGVIAAGKMKDSAPYSEDQFNIFSNIGSLAATSLDKANLFTRTRLRERQLTVLNDISRQLVATESDVEKLLSIITTSAVDILKAEAGSLLLHADDGSGDLEFRVVIGGAGEDLVGQRFVSGEGVVGEVVRSGKPLIVNNAAEDPRHIREVSQDFISRSLLAVPLIAKEQVIGVLEVLNKLDGSPFSDDDADLLTTFAGQAAVAIENARLFQLTDQQLEERVRQLETLERMDAELNRTQTLDDVAEITLRWAMNVLRADAGALGIVRESPPVLEIVAIQGYSPDEYPEGADGLNWPVDRGIVGRVMRSRQADIAMDVSIDPDYNGALQNSNSQFTLPMMSGQEVNAILILEKNTLPRFSLPEWDFAKRLAEHASISIENAQFFQALDNSNKTRSEFMGFAAHELKNPLASVTGYADVLKSGMLGQLSEKQHEFIEVIHNNAKRMETIISDLRDAAKIDANEFRVDPEPMNVYKAVIETLRPFSRSLEEKGQNLVNNVPENLPLIMGDETRIIQVLTNLVSNAHKYSPANTTITIAGELVEDFINKEGKRRGKMVQLAVIDEGIGMSEDDQARLFKERYFRGSNQQAQEQPGTGLGMTLTHTIIHQHKGEIWVNSKLGEGSTFYVAFPLAEDFLAKNPADLEAETAAD